MIEVNTKNDEANEIENVPCMEVELRQMLCEINTLTRADGSAILTQGKTVVIASVYGPIEVKLQNLQIEKAYVEVYYKPKFGIPNVNDRFREQIIRNVCESALLLMMHPRTAITIQLQEMENHGGLIACSINAACLALLNSGLPMKYLFGAVNCIIDKNSELIIDPTSKQSDKSIGQMTCVFDSVQSNIIAIHTMGKFTIGQYNDALHLCTEASKSIFQFYRETIQKFSHVL